MAKRVVYRVQWKGGRWWMTGAVPGWTGKAIRLRWAYSYKSAAIRDARCEARNSWDCGTPSQLVVHNKNGRIAFEHSYGADPRRSKG